MTTEVQCTCGAVAAGFPCKDDCLTKAAAMDSPDGQTATQPPTRPPRRKFAPPPPPDFNNVPSINFERNIPFGHMNPYKYNEHGEIVKYVASGFHATLENIRPVSTKYGERLVLVLKDVLGIPGGKAEHWCNTALTHYCEMGEFSLGERYTFNLPPGDSNFHNIEVEEWL